MAANNASNINTQGVCYCNGSGVFSGLDGSTSGFVLTSNGTGVAPSFQAAGGGGLLSTSVVLTSAQVKALRASPQTIIAAQGSGTFISVVSVFSKMTYGGTNVFTNGQACELFYAGSSVFTSGAAVSSQITASVSTYATATFGTIVPAATACENNALLIKNNGASEITGNAANNNTLTIAVLYRVVSI